MKLMMKKSQLTKSYILKKVSEALKEDFGSRGDITSNALIPRDHKSTGTIVSNDASVLCGIEFAKLTFKKLDKNIKFLSSRKDGSKISNNPLIIDFWFLTIPRFLIMEDLSCHIYFLALILLFVFSL